MTAITFGGAFGDADPKVMELILQASGVDEEDKKLFVSRDGLVVLM